MPTDSEHETLPLVPENIAAQAGEDGALLKGGRCPHCRRDFFPRPRYCPQCLRPPQEHPLRGEGSLYSFTVVRTRPPFGLPQPYAVGFIDLQESGLRVFGHLDHHDIERLAIGKAVRLRVGPLGRDSRGEACLRPYFSLAEEGGHD